VILEHVEITKIMAAPDMRTHAGYRNRIILEILYDTGIQSGWRWRRSRPVISISCMDI
jgi:site-specific recombinase XerD